MVLYIRVVTRGLLETNCIRQPASQLAQIISLTIWGNICKVAYVLQLHFIVSIETFRSLRTACDSLHMFVVDSLVPRLYKCVRERVWLHKSKSLGPLQNLKVSNEIAKWHLLE